jgi:hypothetical protein
MSSTPGRSVTNNTNMGENESMPVSRGLDMSEIGNLIISREMSRESDEYDSRPIMTANRIGLPNILTKFKGEYDLNTVNRNRLNNVS